MPAEPLKPFGEMTPDDYAALGFKSGLEIHQQLLTSRKLFCRCPAGRYSHAYDAEILRHMRPTLSELGEYDGTALMEFKTRKEIIYQIKRESVCTYEMDDTPPFELNEEALDIALEIGMMYGCTMVDEIHIARKQYLDGSIPTGFQRTTIVGVNGAVPYRGRRIGIIQLGLEEDSCREVSDVGHRRVYLTDRLGMPLIETVTAPDMRTPQEAKDVAEILRAMVRTTGKVRTGAGAARQDVNVSVTGGTRIEIKGVPSLPAIPLLTYNEAMRQWRLLRLRDELARRGITSETFQMRVEEVTRLLRRTRFQPVRIAIGEGMSVFCVALRGYRGLLRWQTQTDTFFSREISDRVRVIACLTTLPNITHSDSPSEALATSEWQMLRKATGSTDDDTLVLVWGPEADGRTAAQEIVIRAREATIGVPSETRQALTDGTTGFERILPGPDRMYPDTDLPPKRIPAERLERLRHEIPMPVWERQEWYESLGVPAHLVRPLALSRYAELFRWLVREQGLDPVLCAVALVEFPLRIARRTGKAFTVGEGALRGVFAAYRSGSLAREGILTAFGALAAGEDVLAQLPPGPPSPGELAFALREAREELAAITLRNPEREREVLLGLLMKRVRGRVAGSAAAEEVSRLVISG